VPELLQALQDKEALARQKAVFAARPIGPDAEVAVPALIRLA